MRSAIAVLAVLLAGATAHAQRMKLAVMPAQFDKSSEGMVPKLFDEYVLAAVQNAGDYEVIGQDDIMALVGFEKQKDMLGCDDASCIANIGGALGVDRVIAIKIARLDPDWVVTSKLINIKQTRVEARTTDMVVGNVKALLNAVPDIVAKLFATAQGHPPPAATVRRDTSSDEPSGKKAPPPERTRTAALTTPPPGATGFVPGDSHGRVARTVGQILTWSGVGCAALSLIYGYTLSSTSTWDPYNYTYNDTRDPAGPQAGAMVGGACLLLTGIGSGIYLNGKARALTGDDDASGHVWYRWAGWVLLVGGALAPLATDDADRGLLLGAAGLGSSALLFALSMASNGGYATSAGMERPFASLTILRVPGPGEHAVPALALASTF